MFFYFVIIKIFSYFTLNNKFIKYFTNTFFNLTTIYSHIHKGKIQHFFLIVWQLINKQAFTCYYLMDGLWPKHEVTYNKINTFITYINITFGKTT